MLMITVPMYQTQTKPTLILTGLVMLVMNKSQPTQMVTVSPMKMITAHMIMIELKPTQILIVTAMFVTLAQKMPQTNVQPHQLVMALCQNHAYWQVLNIVMKLELIPSPVKQIAAF